MVFRDIGPIGRVPVLISETGIIPESQVILEYLEESFPHARRLLPLSPDQRAQCRLVARVVDAYLMPPLVALAGPHQTDDDRHAALHALQIIEELVGENSFAAGDCLSLADCALAPALFAAGVTGERMGFNIFDGRRQLDRYAEGFEQQRDVRRVLIEMREGLHRLEPPQAEELGASEVG